MHSGFKALAKIPKTVSISIKKISAFLCELQRASRLLGEETNLHKTSSETVLLLNKAFGIKVIS